jgi:hypothetical protein
LLCSFFVLLWPIRVKRRIEQMGKRFR